MSMEFIVRGVVVGNRKSLEKISDGWKNLNNSLDIWAKSSIDENGNLRFIGQMTNNIGVAAAIDKFLTDDVKCYRLWGTIDGCCELYTDDIEHKFFNKYFVNYLGAEEETWTFFATNDDVVKYLMERLGNNPKFMDDFKESGETDMTKYLLENSIDYGYRTEPDDPVMISEVGDNGEYEALDRAYAGEEIEDDEMAWT